jgi:1,2-diacylglycerol 3-alpha-glucosyltransferase
VTVGQFNDSFPPTMDGVAVVARNYAHWIDRKHGDAVVVTPRVPGRDEESFPVIEYASLPVPGSGSYRLGLPWLDPALRRRLAKVPFDIVHAHCPFSSGRIALKLARSRGIPIVATFHSQYRDDFRKVFRAEWVADLLLRRVVRFFQSVDEVWVPNEAAGEVLRSYGFTKELRVQANGTDLLPPTEEEEARSLRAAGRAFAGVPGDRTLALYVGQQRREKNVHLIISALAELKRGGRVSVSGLFVGNGPELSEFKRLARDGGLGDDAVFTGRVRSRARMRSLYAAADLFVFPSEYDTDGIVITEAAAFEVPAIVLRGAPPSSRIRDGVDGLVCENSVESVAGAIERIAEDPGLGRRLGAEARRALYRSLEDVADSVFDRYTSVLRVES